MPEKFIQEKKHIKGTRMQKFPITVFAKGTGKTKKLDEIVRAIGSKGFGQPYFCTYNLKQYAVIKHHTGVKGEFIFCIEI